MADWSTNEEIRIFQEYLRIPSVHPDVDYGKNVLSAEAVRSSK